MNIQLVRPHIKYESSFGAGYREMQSESESTAWSYLGASQPFNLFEQSFPEFVELLLKRGTEPLPGKVADSVFWAISQDEVVGRISVRHELNENLLIVGGHIGYIVRPSFRNIGVGTQMLKEVLSIPLVKSIGRILMTCDDNNVASNRMIQSVGGLLEDAINMGEGLPKKNRYWISVS